MINFKPWSKRNTEPEPRVHRELTDPARIRLSNILNKVSGEHARKAYDEFLDYTGSEIPYFNASHGPGALDSQYKLIRNEEDLDLVIDYIEILLNIAWSDGRDFSNNDILRMSIKIERALKEEGILLHITPTAKEIIEKDYYRPLERDHEEVRFQWVSDESIIESDQEVRRLALGDRWTDPLKGYNNAWEIYKDEEPTFKILEKLYNSLEDVLEKICVDLEGWNDQGDGVGAYLDSLKQNDIFQPNNSQIAEWENIEKGIRIGIQKTGANRKNEHNRIDEDYCLLMLHQTSAFLSFVIKRYEKEYGRN